MYKQSNEAALCKQYLINCFVHPNIAKRFTTWEQVKRYEKGQSIEDIFPKNTETLLSDDTSKVGDSEDT